MRRLSKDFEYKRAIYSRFEYNYRSLHVCIELLTHHSRPEAARSILLLLVLSQPQLVPPPAVLGPRRHRRHRRRRGGGRRREAAAAVERDPGAPAIFDRFNGGNDFPRANQPCIGKLPELLSGEVVEQAVERAVDGDEGVRGPDDHVHEGREEAVAAGAVVLVAEEDLIDV